MSVDGLGPVYVWHEKRLRHFTHSSLNFYRGGGKMSEIILDFRSQSHLTHQGFETGQPPTATYRK